MDQTVKNKYRNLIRILFFSSLGVISIFVLGLISVGSHWDFLIFLVPLFAQVILLSYLLAVANILTGIWLLIKHHDYKNFILLIIAATIALSPSYQEWFSPQARQARIQHKQENNAAKERYAVLSERFKQPQTVQKVINREHLFLDDVTSVTVFYQRAGDQTYEKRLAFENYIKENVIGKQVTIKLPPEDFFVNNYCCYGKGENIDSVPAYVYFNGFLLNDYFDKDLPLPTPETSLT